MVGQAIRLSRNTKCEIRAAMCFTGAFLIQAGNGVEQTVGNLASYVLSYLRNEDHIAASIGTVMWLFAFMYTSYFASYLVGSACERRFGVRLVVLAGIILNCTGLVGSHFALGNPVAIVACLTLATGLSDGVTTVASAIPCRWYPARTGLVTGVVFSGRNIGGGALNLFISKWVNPHNVAPQMHGEIPYFNDEQIFRNLKTVFLWLAAISPGIQLLGLSMLSEPRNTREELPNESIGNEEVTVRDRAELLIRSKQFRIMWIVNLLIAPAIAVTNGLCKMYGLAVTRDDWLVSIVLSAALVVGLFGRIFWSALSDRFGYTTIMSVLLCFIASLLFTYGIRNTTVYITWTLVIAFCRRGLTPVLFKGIAFYFGTSMLAFDYGLLNTSSLATYMCTPLVFQYGFTQLGYFWSFTIFAFCLFVAMICNIVLDKTQ